MSPSVTVIRPTRYTLRSDCFILTLRLYLMLTDSYSTDLLCRYSMRCIRCPTANKLWSRARRERPVQKRVASRSLRMKRRRRRARSRTRRKKTTHRRAPNVDPNSSMIRLAGAGRAWFRVPTLRSTLGRRLRSRRRRSPSSPRLLLPRLGRLCHGSRWTSLLLQGEYLACVYVGRLKIFLL